MREAKIEILGHERETQLIEFHKLCFPSDFWKDEDWHELLCDPRAIYYALLNGDKLIGNVFIDNWQGEDDYIKIMNLSVHPNHRGSGLAHKLLDHVTAEMSKLGMKRFCAETRATNSAMQKVFEDCGYHLNRMKEGYFDNPPESAYQYVLEIL